MEEAPESYKDVIQVVDTCHDAVISKKVIKLRPIAVVKGWKKRIKPNIMNRIIITKYLIH